MHFVLSTCTSSRNQGLSPPSHGLGNEVLQVLALFPGHTGRGEICLVAGVIASRKCIP